MPRETEGLEGINVKEHNGSDCVNCFTPQWTHPITRSQVLLENNPLLRTMDNTVIGV